MRNKSLRGKAEGGSAFLPCGGWYASSQVNSFNTSSVGSVNPIHLMLFFIDLT
jgi:hypothetical protein